MNMIQEKIQILGDLLKSCVNYPKDIKIEMDNRPKEIWFFVHCNEADKGLVIGKKGKNINALRSLAKLLFGKDFPGKPILTDIWEEEGTTQEVRPKEDNHD